MMIETTLAGRHLHLRIDGTAWPDLGSNHADGRVDSSFQLNQGPSFNYGDRVTCLALQAGGKVLIGGGFGLARLNSNGTQEAGINPARLNGAVHALAVQPDRRILAGGSFTTVNGVGRNGIARINADVECHWGTTVGSMVKIVEKNYFAALDYRTGLVIAGSVFVMLISAILDLGMFSGTPAGFAAGLSPLSLILPAAILARRVGWSWPCVVLMPFMFPVFLYTLLNSTFVTLRQCGICWRETFYPLKTLRAGNVR